MGYSDVQEKKVREGWREIYHKEFQAYISQIFVWVIETGRIR
jgi:hypothetical protein